MIPKLVQKIDVDTRYIREKNASLLLGQYVGQDKPWALLVVSDYGEHLLTPTINLEAYGLSPAPGHAFIKDYSENEGVLASLQNSGVISAPVRTVSAGYATAYEVRLLFDQDEVYARPAGGF